MFRTNRTGVGVIALIAASTFSRQRRVLVVDDEGGVITDDETDVAAGPDEHVDGSGDGDAADLYAVEILLRAKGKRDEHDEGSRDQERFARVSNGGHRTPGLHCHRERQRHLSSRASARDLLSGSRGFPGHG